MNLSKLLTSALMACICSVGAEAQTYYDITAEYLRNTAFDSGFDYPITADGDTKNVENPLEGWTKLSSTFALLATFQYGTGQTFLGYQPPATGFDGTANGGALMFYAGGRIRYYQEIKLPAGNYRIVTAWYNCNSKAAAGSCLTGWITGTTSSSLTYASTLTNFPSGQWVVDTVSFTLTASTQGRIQLGFRGSIPDSTSAVPAVDFIRLLRDTPIGDQDFSGDEPRVTTDKRFARGATMAFGRMTATIGDGTISERGFCWSEQPEPTINDFTTTEMLSNGAYWLRDLKPATKYYMRAYAKTEGRRVGYGEVIKFYTIPEGQIGFSMRTSGDENSERIRKAAQTAVDWWNALTEMKGFNTSIGYNAGVPTAECSYGGWMSVGSNTSYQRPGTIMHEMLHGVGVIPWADTEWSRHNLRSGVNGDGFGTGLWLGDRVTEVLRFWDNNSTSQLNGDYQHMWPYGINGASEDNGSNELYIGNGLVCQALGEDGLQHTSQLYAEPYYAFDQEDDVKYYLKNEDADRGLYTAYLIPTATGTLQWRDMTASEAAANDSAAWYVTFTPSNQYYQLRNAATGQYLTYATNGFRTATRSTLTANDNFHLMRSRVDVATGNASGPVIPADNTRRAYWLIHPTNNWTPACLQANANGQVGSATFNIANSATTQRWLILSEREMFVQEQNAVSTLQKQMADLLAPIKALLRVPHVELATGIDDTFAARLADFEQRLVSSTSPSALLAIETEARQAAYEFLCDAKPTDDTNPFDLTYLIKNPGMDSTEGWTGSPSLSYSCAEFYQKTFNFNQTISQLPAGNYRFLAQGFQRPGQSADAYNDYVAGNNNVTASLYAGDDSQLLAHIASEARSTKLGGNEATVGGNKYIPSNMEAASKYFAKGLYQNVVTTTVADASPAGNTLRVGIRSTSMPSYYWAIFDNFRLQYLGRTIPGDVNNDGQVGIGDIVAITNVMAGTITDEATIATADVNNDNEVGIGDIVAITNIMAGIAN
jgi:hypothetical protein